MATPLATGDHVTTTAELFTWYGDALLNYARRRVTDSDADDVVSEVFLIVAAGKAVPEGAGALPWLYAVAYRVVLRHRTQAGHWARLQDRLRSRDLDQTVTDVGSAVSSAHWVNSLIDRLSARDAELLRLVVFEDLDIPSAALALGVSPGAVHTRLHRIRHKVQPWLSPGRGVDAAIEPTNEGES